MKYYRALLVAVCLIVTTSMLYAQLPSAGVILKVAFDKATKENKNVFVIFRASWCGWCRKMDSSMNDKTCKKFFEENYITCHLRVEESKGVPENPGANEFKNNYNGKDAGLPFWLIFDKKGRLLADSGLRPKGADLNVKGDNIGCPGAKAEVEYFISVLRKTSRLGAPQLAIIAERFGKNANN